jgi:hypothetical protein
MAIITEQGTKASIAIVSAPVVFPAVVSQGHPVVPLGPRKLEIGGFGPDIS